MSAYEALELADYFRVSYAAMLHRLWEERLVDGEQRKALAGYSPKKMAEQLKLNPEEFDVPRQRVLFLERYPISVLERVSRAVEDGRVSVSQVADVLDATSSEVEERLKLFSNPPEASSEELRQLGEFPRRYPSTGRKAYE